MAEKVVRTAGKPHHIELVSNRNELTADGKDLAYVTVKVVDKDGNPGNEKVEEGDELVCYGRYRDFQAFWKAI